MKRWYVVQTQPRKERLAEYHLNRQGFVTFCPLKRGSRRVGSRSQTVLDPFFPNYLFVALDTARQRWRSVNGTIGVTRLVSFGATPEAVPTGLVERFQALSDSSGELRFDERLSPGDRVRVVGGPLDRLCGVLQSAGIKERVTVLLQILSDATEVELERSRLVAI